MAEVQELKRRSNLSAKKRKLNNEHQHDHFKHSPTMSFSQTQLASFHEQIMALKQTHGMTPSQRKQSPPNNTRSLPSDSQPCKQETKLGHHSVSTETITNDSTPPPQTQAKLKKPRDQAASRTNTNKATSQPTKAIVNQRSNAAPPTTTIHAHTADTDTKTDTQHALDDDDDDALLEIDDHQNVNESPKEHDWDSFMHSAFDEDDDDVARVTANTLIAPNSSQHRSSSTVDKTHTRMRSIDVAEVAAATESDWHDFLSVRYDADDVRKSDWKPPEINTFWEQGPIGQVMSWWNDDQFCTYVDQSDAAAAAAASKANAQATSAAEASKRQQLRIIKRDVMKELKQQKLQKQLESRIEGGEVVQNMDTANNPFESFFTAALELGDDIRSGAVDVQQLLQEEKQPKKTKRIQPKFKKLKQIATLADDDLFFFDDSDKDGASDDDDDDGDKEGEHKEFLRHINPNDLIHINENSIAQVGDSQLAADKLRSEHVLLQQRVQFQRAEMATYEMAMDGVEDGANDAKRVEVRDKSSNAILTADVLTDTVEDAAQEKKILKKLNVMDYVHRYKDPFYREVEELNLNLDALLQNWGAIKQNTQLGRKLKKKLGIMMARQRVKQRKDQQARETVVVETESASNKQDSDDTDTDMFHMFLEDEF